MKKTFIILASLILTACATKQQPVSEEQAYVTLLAQEVKSSDSIVFIEHSYKFDFFDRNNPSGIDIEKAPTYIYKTQKISADQQKKFLSALMAIEEKNVNMVSSCIFVPHHRIEFYKSGKLTSSMEICFHCADIEWSATINTRPIALVGVLANTFVEAGFKTSKDWSALAKHWPENAKQ
ncbi:hypothetical protein HBN76_06520 [Pseudomonas sp. WS 5013]|uniref:hypothetical protein n=1 Tax=Pseudomonas sp. WS 5013 TaxID=2717475 RepID=UPI001473559C|nr:hypothetical protein [Pseudomonas sp. WS 5013]NMY40950.1 hypothetical protein [Pseudomonas sp. WS 5013]